jgi:hypothetical protein
MSGDSHGSGVPGWAVGAGIVGVVAIGLIAAWGTFIDPKSPRAAADTSSSLGNGGYSTAHNTSTGRDSWGVNPASGFTTGSKPLWKTCLENHGILDKCRINGNDVECRESVAHIARQCGAPGV